MLEARDISISYRSREVLRGVSFAVRDGSVTALLGPNGAGKSTLMRALNGAISSSAAKVSGEVLFGGERIVGLSRREIASRIAVVAQENETRFPVTVIEFVLAGRFVHGNAFGWETPADIEAAKRSLADCDLAGYDERLMNELSGGERQRVVLARAMATNARLLLLDEPTANLDLAHQRLMFRLVRHRCDTCGGAAVVITHDLDLAAAYSDSILLLDAGRLTAAGHPEEVLTAENVARVFGVEVSISHDKASGRVRVANVY